MTFQSLHSEYLLLADYQKIFGLLPMLKRESLYTKHTFNKFHGGDLCLDQGERDEILEHTRLLRVLRQHGYVTAGAIRCADP